MMKKSLVALAAFAAASAFAQSSVTLYGVVDQGFNTDKKTVGTTTTKVTGLKAILSGNRVGFKGTEDLGGGLKANFQLEYAAQVDDASTAGALNTNRNSFVGLSGGFGSVTAGLVYTLIHSVQGAYDTNGNATAAGWLGGSTSRVRQANAVTYTTPNFSGFTAQLQAGFGENANTGVATDNTGNSIALGLNYDNGPISIKLASDSVKLTALTYTPPGATALTLSNALGNRKDNSLGASYNFGVAKLTAVVTSSKAGSAADEGKATSRNLGVSVPLGAFALNATASSGKYIDSGAASVKVTGYQAGVNYSLSKRTTAYVLGGQGKHKHATAATASKHTTFAVGLRHIF